MPMLFLQSFITSGRLFIRRLSSATSFSNSSTRCFKVCSNSDSMTSILSVGNVFAIANFTTVNGPVRELSLPMFRRSGEAENSSLRPLWDFRASALKKRPS